MFSAFAAWMRRSIVTDLSTLLGRYDESTAPIVYFCQSELKFLNEVGSGSVCAMRVPNNYERNLEVARFVRHDSQILYLVIVLCDPEHSWVVFPRETVFFYSFSIVYFKTCLWGRLRWSHSRLIPVSHSSPWREFRTWVLS